MQEHGWIKSPFREYSGRIVPPRPRRDKRDRVHRFTRPAAESRLSKMISPCINNVRIGGVLAPVAGLLLPVVLAGIGCSAGGAPLEKRTAAERPDIAPAMAAKGLLKIPAEQAFNYTSFQSGQAGSGRGEAAAQKADGARCTARSEGDGNAWGEFYLGYCFDNTSGAPLDGAVKLRLRASQARSLDHHPGDARTEAATASLRFVIKDTNGQTLRSEQFISSDDPRGSSSGQFSPELSYATRFEPDRGYYIVLIGRTETKSGRGHTAEASLDVSGISLEISWQTARAGAKEAPAESAAAGAVPSTPR